MASNQFSPEGLNGLQVPSGIPVYEHPALPYLSEDRVVHAFREENKLYASRTFMDMLKNHALGMAEEAQMYRCIEIQTRVAGFVYHSLWDRLRMAWKGTYPTVYNQLPRELYLPVGLPALRGALVGDILAYENHCYVIAEKKAMNPVHVGHSKREASDNIYSDPL